MVPFMEDETYHVFNRGAHKNPIFLEERDFQRFQVLLLLANSTERIDAGNVLNKYQGRSLVKLFEEEGSDERIVDILAYSLLPNHFHLILRQRMPEGISKFMRKLCTGYSMYFNLKYGHSGTLYQGRFKSSHVDTDAHFNWLFAYVHLNPLSLAMPEWKVHGIEDVEVAQHFLDGYPYSSYFDFYVASRPERAILAYEDARHFIDSKNNLIDLAAAAKKDVQYETFEPVEKGVDNDVDRVGEKDVLQKSAVLQSNS